MKDVKTSVRGSVVFRWVRRLVSCERRSVVLETAVIDCVLQWNCAVIFQRCRDRFIFDIGVAAATAVAVIELL